MLGSPHDADDALREALVRAWRTVARFEGRSSLHSWLYRIVTREVAEALETTPASVTSALQRARAALDERLPDQSQQATLRALGDERVRDVVERFTDAFVRADLGAIISLLAEDVRFSMPPHPDWYQGGEAVSGSWLIPDRSPTGLRYLRTRANGQLALGTYLRARASAAGCR